MARFPLWTICLSSREAWPTDPGSQWRQAASAGSTKAHAVGEARRSEASDEFAGRYGLGGFNRVRMQVSSPGLG